MSWLWSLVEQIHHLLATANHLLSNPLHIHPLPRILTQLQVIVVLIEQINDLLVIDLEEGTSDDETYPLRYLIVNAVEQVLHSSRNKSLMLLEVLVLRIYSHHRVSFTRTGLTVGEDSAIVTLVILKIPSKQSKVQRRPTLSKIYYCGYSYEIESNVNFLTYPPFVSLSECNCYKNTQILGS
jgi:hypothetical protein